MSYLTPDEKRDVEEKTSQPLDPVEALEVIETSAEVFNIEVAIRLRDMHLSGVQITFDLAGEIAEEEK